MNLAAGTLIPIDLLATSSNLSTISSKSLAKILEDSGSGIDLEPFLIQSNGRSCRTGKVSGTQDWARGDMPELPISIPLAILSLTVVIFRATSFRPLPLRGLKFPSRWLSFSMKR
jgi:hypothetical protein